MNYKYEGEIGQIEIKIEDEDEEVDDSFGAVWGGPPRSRRYRSISCLERACQTVVSQI